MLKSNGIRFLGGLFAFVITLACSALSSIQSTRTPVIPTSVIPKLPNYGVFLVDRGSFHELEQYTGQPDKQSIQYQLQTTSSNPVFWVWYPQMKLEYFLLVTLDSPGIGIPYKITPKDSDNQILEIKPNNPLADDIYCFYQGDPLGNPYSLPFWCFEVVSNTSNEIPSQPTQSGNDNFMTASPQQTLDGEALVFRDKALKVIQEFKTMEYSIKTLESSNPSEDFDYGNGTSTLNAMHETTFKENGEINAEVISVDTTFCIRGTSTWSCYPQGPYSMISNIISILKGEAPYRPFYREVTSVGTKLETYNGVECRAFYVVSTYTSNETLNESIDEICLDLEGYYPLRILSKTKISQNGVVTYAGTYETYDLKFNVSINEIVLPQQ